MLLPSGGYWRLSPERVGGPVWKQMLTHNSFVGLHRADAPLCMMRTQMRLAGVQEARGGYRPFGSCLRRSGHEAWRPSSPTCKITAGVYAT